MSVRSLAFGPLAFAFAPSTCKALSWQEEARLFDYVKLRGLRIVPPYNFEYQVNAKQRWIGRRLVDVFAAEFPHFNFADPHKVLLSCTFCACGSSHGPKARKGAQFGTIRHQCAHACKDQKAYSRTSRWETHACIQTETRSFQTEKSIGTIGRKHEE